MTLPALKQARVNANSASLVVSYQAEFLSRPWTPHAL